MHREPYFDRLLTTAVLPSLTHARASGGLDDPDFAQFVPAHGDPATGRRTALQRRFRKWMASLYPPGLPMRWRAWNCLPAAGDWRADARRSDGTGMACELIYCPWCWIRQARFFENMLIESAEGKHPLHWHRPRREVRGAGMGDFVDVTLIETEDNVFSRPAELDYAVFNDFMRRCTQAMKQGWVSKSGLAIPTGQADFQKAVRITSVFTRSGTDVGLRTCYLYDSSSMERAVEPSIGMVGNMLSGPAALVRHRCVRLPEAVMMAYPFLKHLYSMSLADIGRLITMSYHRRKYALIGYKVLGKHKVETE